MRKERFEIISKNTNLPIIGDIRFIDGGAKPVIVFIHGSFGYKAWGFFPYISERLAEAGFVVITINYSTDAMEEGSDKVYSPEIYAKVTISQLIDETLLIVSSIKNGLIEEIKGEFNGDIYLCGFSLGGGVSLLAANRCADIKKICLIAPIGKFNRYSERHCNEWIERGYWEMAKNDIGQVLRLNSDYIIDIIANKDKYNIAKNFKSLKIPTKVLHGDLDRTVRESEIFAEIEKAKNSLVEYEQIEKANHTFGVSRNFLRETTSLSILIEKTINFFKSK